MQMISKAEKDILVKIRDSQLISKAELSRFLGDKPVDFITRQLVEKRLVATISPVGYTCYIITQAGTQFLKELEE